MIIELARCIYELIYRILHIRSKLYIHILFPLNIYLEMLKWFTTYENDQLRHFASFDVHLIKYFSSE